MQQQFGDRHLQGVLLSRDAFDRKVANHQTFLESLGESRHSWHRMTITSPDDEVQYLVMSGLNNDHLQGNFRRVTVRGLDVQGLNLRLTSWSHGRLEMCTLTECDLSSSVSIVGTTADCKFYECHI